MFDKNSSWVDNLEVFYYQSYHVNWNTGIAIYLLYLICVSFSWGLRYESMEIFGCDSLTKWAGSLGFGNFWLAPFFTTDYCTALPLKVTGSFCPHHKRLLLSATANFYCHPLPIFIVTRCQFLLSPTVNFYCQPLPIFIVTHCQFLLSPTVNFYCHPQWIFIDSVSWKSTLCEEFWKNEKGLIKSQSL